MHHEPMPKKENPGMASSLPITAAKQSYGCPNGRVAPDRQRDGITGLRFRLFILNRKRLEQKKKIELLLSSNKMTGIIHSAMMTY